MKERNRRKMKVGTGQRGGRKAVKRRGENERSEMNTQKMATRYSMENSTRSTMVCERSLDCSRKLPRL
jgi:hypothetical protein